jgi:glycosyltransferase involved in cell wall biosynthesis
LTQSIRVAQLVTSVEFGGIERVVLTLFRHADRDIAFVPIVFVRTDTLDRTFVHEINRLGVSPRVLYVDKSRLGYLSPFQHTLDVLAVLRRERFDLIHSHGYRADIVALPLSIYFRVPVVSTCHGFTVNDRRLAIYSKLNTLALRRFRRVIAVSSRMRDELIDRGVNPMRIDVIPNAAEPVGATVVRSARNDLRARLGITDDEFVFGFVGRLSVEKGLEHLLGALTLGSLGSRSWRLLVVGDGPLRSAIEESAASAGLGSRVIFAGFQHDVSPWFAAMDAFVLPSMTEGTPMALLEAMTHGVPVIASAVGGVPAVVSHRANGVLVPPGDRRALSAALCEIASDGALRRSLSAAGHETVRKQYDVHAWAAAVRSVYERALQSS